jgi:dipeptidyl-peptidase-4
MTIDSAMSMLRRYSRAVRLTAPKIVAETPDVAEEGYWIDNNLFFFLAERIEPTLGRMVAIPSIADCEADSMEEIISLEALAGLLFDQSDQPLGLEELSSAEFDMPNRDTLGVSVRGHDYLIDRHQRCVIMARASLDVSALYSPDGRYACFVKGYNLWLKQRDTGAEWPLTTNGTAHHSYAQQSETSLSAVSYRQHPSPVGLWSPDSSWILTHRIDERSLPELALIENAPPGGGRPVLHTYKYPMPGDPLPIATYVAIHIASGRVITFDDFLAPVMAFSPFMLRMAWFDGCDRAYFIRFDRYFKRADLVSLDLTQGTGRIVLSETVASGYLDLHPFILATPNVRTLRASSEIIWFSERDGWGHLYLYDGSTGVLKNQITSGDWLVRDIVHVNEAQRKLLFLAGGIDPKDDPARRWLCSVNLDGSGFEILLNHDGDIFLPKTEPCGLVQDRPFRPSNASPGVSPDSRFAIVRYESVDRGSLAEIIELRSRRGFPIASARPTPDEVPARHFTAKAADNLTCLHGVMFLPPNFDESRQYPLIDCIYPGPQRSHQPQSFHAVSSALPNALAELGFITVMFDTRGMPICSRALHQVGYGALLEPQLADHVSVVRQLCERLSFIDGDRVGMIGWSGGGFATARALFDCGEIFKVGVAACGNHDPRFYTAMWSDKYRGAHGGETWGGQASGASAHKLNGKLLLISGDMDENVHVSHTLSLADALIRANKDFDLLIVPNADHNVLIVNGYVQRRVWDYFVRNLLGETPPQNFEIKFEPRELARLEKRLAREYRQ